MTLKDTQQVTLSIAPTDAKGNPAKVDGVPVWQSSDATVATVEAAADGLSAVVKAGIPGDAVISVQADADLGAGVTPIAGTLDINVQAGDATQIGLVAGEITEQPPVNSAAARAARRNAGASTAAVYAGTVKGAPGTR